MLKKKKLSKSERKELVEEFKKDTEGLSPGERAEKYNDLAAGYQNLNIENPFTEAELNNMGIYTRSPLLPTRRQFLKQLGIGLGLLATAPLIWQCFSGKGSKEKRFGLRVKKDKVSVHLSYTNAHGILSLGLSTRKNMTYEQISLHTTGTKNNALTIQKNNQGLPISKRGRVYVPKELLQSAIERIMNDFHFTLCILRMEKGKRMTLADFLYSKAIQYNHIYANNNDSLQAAGSILLLINENIDMEAQIIEDESEIILPFSFLPEEIQQRLKGKR